MKWLGVGKPRGAGFRHLKVVFKPRPFAATSPPRFRCNEKCRYRMVCSSTSYSTEGLHVATGLRKIPFYPLLWSDWFYPPRTGRELSRQMIAAHRLCFPTRYSRSCHYLQQELYLKQAPPTCRSRYYVVPELVCSQYHSGISLVSTNVRFLSEHSTQLHVVVDSGL